MTTERRSALLLCVLVCVLVAALAAGTDARAQAQRAVEVQHLWNSFPLDPKAGGVRPKADGLPTGGGDPSPPLEALLVAALAFANLAVLFAVRAVRGGAFRRLAGTRLRAPGSAVDAAANGHSSRPAVRVATSAVGDASGQVLFVSGDGVSLAKRGTKKIRNGPDAPQKIAGYYLSPDTAPKGFAVVRSSWAAPAFLLSFVALCVGLVQALPALTRSYGAVVSTLAGVPERELVGEGASISFRPFFALLLVLLSFFAVGTAKERLKLLAFSFSLYAASVLALDVVLARAHGSWLPTPFEPVGGIAAGFAGLLAIIVSVFVRYRLPHGVRVVRKVRGPPAVLVVLMACVAAALAITTLFSYLRLQYFDGVHIRLIGGLDSELVIFLLAVVGLLFVASLLNERTKPAEGPQLSVAFLIPAFNEAHCIEDTIRAIDEAAAVYGGPCTLYVADNGSQDGTPEVAARAIESCSALRGAVLECPLPGKSRALNYGLSFISADVVVRIDADTIVPPSVIREIVPWFWDSSVGGVSGLPLPKATTPRWLYPLRMIEVYYGVAFLRVAQAAADGVMVMPGLIAAYRRNALDELGGFAEGINGEDADITMRIGRLGYRIVTDPAVKVYTEVPEDLAHLREQRQRWARGLFHMAGRNMSTIWMRQGVRGLWILPWSLFNAARRLMMIPVLLCALTVELLEPTVFALREISVVAGFIVGLQLIVILVILLAHRQFRVLPFIPAYLVFRLFRSYIAFEALLTLPLARPARGDAFSRPATPMPEVAGAARGEPWAPHAPAPGVAA
jgi:cellulose synthase/poly-beta-1,6-N-acetylglucosamine synthase-like glycosyltransferase